jgi:hypothetical protein
MRTAHVDNNMNQHIKHYISHSYHNYGQRPSSRSSPAGIAAAASSASAAAMRRANFSCSSVASGGSPTALRSAAASIAALAATCSARSSTAFDQTSCFVSLHMGLFEGGAHALDVTLLASEELSSSIVMDHPSPHCVEAVTGLDFEGDI